MIIKENKTYTLELNEKELEIIQILVGHCYLHTNKNVLELSRVLDETDNNYDFSKLSYEVNEFDGLSIEIKE